VARLFGLETVSVLLVACGPTLTESETMGQDTAAGGTTMAVGEETEAPYEPLPPHCEPIPEDGIDPFAAERPCEAYDGRDTTEIPQIEVRIINRMDVPIVVRDHTVGCGQPARSFAVEGTIGGRPVHAVTNFCPVEWNFCGDWTGETSACHLCLTVHPPIRIEPGGASLEIWNAWVLGEVVLPAQCNEFRESEEVCNAPMPVEPGRYALRAEAIDVHACEGKCTCEPDERGSCRLPGAGLFSDEASLIATATYDGKCERIDIIFEP
jgi:hypothetical protein